MSRRKAIVGFDINNTLDNMMDVFRQKYNKEFSTNVQMSDLVTYDVRQYFPKVENIFTHWPLEELKFTISDSAKDFVNKCNGKFNVVFVTACYPESVPFWFKLLQETFPWVTREHFVNCYEKQNYLMDVLFDDCADQLVGANYMRFLKKYAWNEGHFVKYCSEFTEFDDALWEKLEQSLC